MSNLNFIPQPEELIAKYKELISAAKRAIYYGVTSKDSYSDAKSINH